MTTMNNQDIVIYPQVRDIQTAPHPGRLLFLPDFDRNILDTGLGFTSQRIFLRKTNEPTKQLASNNNGGHEPADCRQI